LYKVSSHKQTKFRHSNSSQFSSKQNIQSQSSLWDALSKAPFENFLKQNGRQFFWSNVFVSSFQHHNCPCCLWYDLLINSVLQKIGRHLFGTWKLWFCVRCHCGYCGYDPNMRFLVSMVFHHFFQLLSYVRLTSEHESFNEAYSKLRYS